MEKNYCLLRRYLFLVVNISCWILIHGSHQLLNINQEITIERRTSVCTCITLLLLVPQKYNICAQTRIRCYNSCVMMFKTSKNRQPIIQDYHISAWCVLVVRDVYSTLIQSCYSADNCRTKPCASDLLSPMYMH